MPPNADSSCTARIPHASHLQRLLQLRDHRNQPLFRVHRAVVVIATSIALTRQLCLTTLATLTDCRRCLLATLAACIGHQNRLLLSLRTMNRDDQALSQCTAGQGKRPSAKFS